MRDIKDYEGLYAATSCGKIYSYRAKKFLKLRTIKTGYYRVDLYKDGKRKSAGNERLIKDCINSRKVLNHLEAKGGNENERY